MNDEFLKVAKEAALEAGKVIQKYSGNFGKKSIKGGDKSNFATIADIEAEKAVVKILTDNFPGHNIIAEEGTEKNKGSEYTWAIDPLDGTISFAAGIPHFTVSIGLTLNSEPVLGVIYHIANGDLYWAQKKKGAFVNNKKIKVSSNKNLEEGIISLDLGHKHKRGEKFKRYIAPLIFKASYVYSLGSGALSLAYTARGIVDLHIQAGGIWDNLGGTVIIREAGGVVTDFKGKEPDWSKEQVSIVASNGLIHGQILEALKQ